MLKASYLSGVPDEIVHHYAKLESDIINDMARRLSKMGKVTDSTLWQSKIFQEIGGLQSDIQGYIQKYNKDAQKILENLFNEAMQTSAKNDVAAINRAGLSDAQEQILNATVKKTASAGIVGGSAKVAEEANAGYIKVFSGIERMTMSIASSASSEFINQANSSYLKTASGAFDYQTALKQGVDDLAAKGIYTVEYEDSGKKINRSIEAALRANILTGINQTASTITLQNCTDLECDLVEVSAHLGARPEHAAWQGKIYSLSGTHPDYPSFYEVCQPGSVTGIGGINCRHSYYPYFDGAEKHYSNGELDEYEEATVMYNGKEITRYEASQKQRHIERTIRKYKRVAEAEHIAGLDDTAARVKLGEWQAAARDFTAQTGLVRDYSREYIGTPDGKQPTGLNPIVSNYKANEKKATEIKRLDNARNKVIANVPQKSPMNFRQANGGAPNPSFKQGGGFTKNCQSCVVAYELRRRGFNIKTLPNTKGSMLDVLAHKTNIAWIDRNTGKNPTYIVPNQRTIKQTYEYLKTNLENQNRYTIEFLWKGKHAGHIIHFYKNSKNDISLYDPQTGININKQNEVLSYLEKVRPSSIKLLNIQNCDINMNVVNKIVKGV